MGVYNLKCRAISINENQIKIEQSPNKILQPKNFKIDNDNNIMITSQKKKSSRCENNNDQIDDNNSN